MMGLYYFHQRKKKETEMQITTIGLDIAKNVFQLVACDDRGKVLKKKVLTPWVPVHASHGCGEADRLVRRLEGHRIAGNPRDCLRVY